MTARRELEIKLALPPTSLGVLAKSRFRALTLEVAAWLKTGHWMNPEDDLVHSRGEVPIQGFAAD